MNRKDHTKYKKSEEILKAIKDLEDSISPEALILIKKIYKETCAELGVPNETFFSNQSIIERIVKTSYKYEFDETTLEYFVRTITMMCRRFDIDTQTSYDFLIRHVESKNKRIQMVIASKLALLKQFDNYEKKWDYILSIPKITPKKDSFLYFQWTIAHRINEIPIDLKQSIIEIYENHINKLNYKSEVVLETLHQVKNI